MVLEKLVHAAPTKRVIAMAVGGYLTTGAAILYLSQINSSMPDTMRAEWHAATEDYRRYQNMDRVRSS
ncbi:unnamed protein product [Ectocarpus sp. 8 AP-2014]|uniref:Uncharacterized protein n=1 Tax=Ectocarpus siliculosus TaxID=2880 RepID=D8LE57_ECTSI|nr:hypothetical protein Esi_0013_0025 [Ectocarpus siliculosus]|eukprot:CBN74129.1 hypothetical protein Esi_0013_0025 [Ectocarpus siliculosus]